MGSWGLNPATHSVTAYILPQSIQSHLDSVEAVCAGELKRYIATPALALRCYVEDKKTGKMTRVINDPLE